MNMVRMFLLKAKNEFSLLYPVAVLEYCLLSWTLYTERRRIATLTFAEEREDHQKSS